MKILYAAMAAALVITGTGCTALNSCNTCGEDPCHVAQSRFAPRASFQEGRCHKGPGLLERLGWTQGNSCGCRDEVCGGYCESRGCNDGCCGGDTCGNGCLQRGISKLIDCPCGGGGGCGLGGQGSGYCGFGGGGDQNYNFNPGPAVGQTAYPYYTVRGPRDFLMCNPPSIGPR